MHPTIDNFSESQKEVHTIDIDTEIQNIDSIIETEDKIKKIDELFQVQTEVGFVIEMTADGKFFFQTRYLLYIFRFFEKFVKNLCKILATMKKIKYRVK